MIQILIARLRDFDSLSFARNAKKYFKNNTALEVPRARRHPVHVEARAEDDISALALELSG